MDLYPNILNKSQKLVLDKLGFLKPHQFYLGGGTALALQLGHRTSLDFDFYSPEKFVWKALANEFKRVFENIEVEGNQADNTFQITVEGVDVSVFHYPYKLIGKLVVLEPIKLASIEDVAAMKVAAVMQRARQRDFYDLYYLMEKIGMDGIVKAAFLKFPWYEENNVMVFRSLSFFDEADVDKEVDRIEVFDKSVTWDVVKKKMGEGVRKSERGL